MPLESSVCDTTIWSIPLESLFAITHTHTCIYMCVITYDDSRVILQIVASLTDDHNVFIVQEPGLGPLSLYITLMSAFCLVPML
jgi:hypothetical protein